jgi:hypothetical protein
MHWPGITPWLVNDFVRGAVTGLGIVNLAAAIADLVPVLVRSSADHEPGGPVRRSAEREGG